MPAAALSGMVSPVFLLHLDRRARPGRDFDLPAIQGADVHSGEIN